MLFSRTLSRCLVDMLNSADALLGSCSSGYNPLRLYFISAGHVQQHMQYIPVVLSAEFARDPTGNMSMHYVPERITLDSRNVYIVHGLVAPSIPCEST